MVRPEPAGLTRTDAAASASGSPQVMATAVASSMSDIDPRLHALGIQDAQAPAGLLVTPTPTPEATATPTAADLCERSSPQALFCIYTVRSGESLSAIATLFGLTGSADVPAAELLAESNRPDVVNSDSIVSGQKLRIPTQNGILHTVITAETVSDLAVRYGTTSAAILSVNGLAGDVLVIGQDVLVPGPTRIGPPTTTAAPDPTPTPEPTPEATPEPTATPTPTATAAAQAAASTTPVRPTSTPRAGARTATPAPAAARSAASSSGFIWPAAGPISSYYGPSHPLGIDIDFYNNPNQPVAAAMAGTVTFAGGNPCCSYGLYVVIDHGNGFTTLYAHLSTIMVSAGQVVPQGQILGLGGRTGYATGNHLHFEIRLNGNVTNPLNYLP